jgi:quercetin dioxygenase-like cupin family protein
MDFRHFNWEPIAAEQLSPLLQRQFISTQQLTLARFLLKKGCVVPTHQHANEQLALVMEGSLRFIVDGREVVVRAGESLWIPPNSPHSAEALEDTVDIDVFSPPRADWQARDDAYLR